MPTIAAIEITHHRLPLDPPFKASWDGRAREVFDATIVRVTDSDGRVGIGSGDLMVGFGGHEGLFMGRDPRDLERHFEVLSNIQFHYGRCWPLDLALWDLAGKIAGEPVWRLLGGETGAVRLYGSTGVLREPAAMAETALALVEEGFEAIKLRFTSSAGGRGSWRDDVRAVETVRSALGGQVALMVDCNQGWRMPWDTSAPWDFDEALAVARALEPLDIFWMEEPLHRADRKGMAALRRETRLRIAGGEMTRELYEFRDLIEDGCLDVLQPDAALTGGITGLRKIGEMARQAGLSFTPHSWTNGAGVLANAHLAAGIGAAPYFEWPYDPPEWSLDRRDFPLAASPRVSGGRLMLAETPGLGIELNEERLAETRIGGA